MTASMFMLSMAEPAPTTTSTNSYDTTANEEPASPRGSYRVARHTNTTARASVPVPIRVITSDSG